ncbi:hypothetical protein QTP88_026596 [Uroleucon formosanum]
MDNVGIDIKDRNILHVIYKNQEAEIKINSTTKAANIQKGIKQGCPLSPSLFNVYVEQAIRDIKQKLEEQMIGVVKGALYGCETWTLNKKDETALEAFEMWCWRKMEKIKWTELKTNEEVLDLVTEKRTLLNNLRSRRWHMIGHTLRHNEELHSLILEGIEGKRGRGRPRTCYISQVIKDAKVDSYKQLKDKAQDRESWREHLL